MPLVRVQGAAVSFVSHVLVPNPPSSRLCAADTPFPETTKRCEHTEGIARLPLNRLRTRLSIPLGLRHAESRHLKRSLWWRMKRLVPAIRQARQHSCSREKSIADSKLEISSEERCGVEAVSRAVNRCERKVRKTYASSRSGCASWRQPSVRLVRLKYDSGIREDRSSKTVVLYLDGIVVG